MGLIRAVRGVEGGSLASHHFSKGKEYVEDDPEVSVYLHLVCEVLKVGVWCLEFPSSQ